jgi:hypothetical protein
METTTIKVSEYYNNPRYYAFMPETVFDALEAAFLDGNEFADVDKAQFDKMIADYNEKTSR